MNFLREELKKELEMELMEVAVFRDSTAFFLAFSGGISMVFRSQAI